MLYLLRILSQMVKHLRLCSRQPMKCPYSSIGCEIKDASRDSILIHFSIDLLPHTELLIDVINNIN